MKHVLLIVSISFFSLLLGDIKMADVTGDGVDDEIKIGEQSVVVVNGKTGERYTVIYGEPSLYNVDIDDYHKSLQGKEIAVAICPGAVPWTEIYGFKTNRFFQVSEELPGIVTLEEDGSLVGYRRHLWEGGQLYVPCPIVVDAETLKALPVKQEIAKAIRIQAATSKDISYPVQKDMLVVCYAAVLDKDVVVTLQGEDGTVSSKQKVTPTAPFIGGGFTDSDETITLTIDNSYSVMTPKTVYYVIDQYEYKPSKDAIDAAVRSNMHTVQLAVEDYSAIHEGKYPGFVADFKDLLPYGMANPVESRMPAVVDGKTGKPGQVCYVYDSKTGKYKIYGFDSEGKKLPYTLLP